MDYSGRIEADEILTSQWVKEKLRNRANEIKARAEALAPRGKTLKLSTGMSVEVVGRGGAKNDRAIAIVQTNATAADGSGYGSAEEFGTTDSRGNFFLRRAAGEL